MSAGKRVDDFACAARGLLMSANACAARRTLQDGATESVLPTGAISWGRRIRPENGTAACVADPARRIARAAGFASTAALRGIARGVGSA